MNLGVVVCPVLPVSMNPAAICAIVLRILALSTSVTSLFRQMRHSPLFATMSSA